MIAIFHDQPLLGRVSSEGFEAQLLVKLFLYINVFDRQTDGKRAEPHAFRGYGVGFRYSGKRGCGGKKMAAAEHRASYYNIGIDMPRILPGILPVAIAGLTALTFAQAQAPNTFEIASIKPVPESVGWPPRAGYWVLPRADDPKRFRAQIQVSRLIEWAYGVRDFQIQGGPDWVKDGKVRFAIQAMAPRPSIPDEIKQMVQALLADRFKLRMHRGTRELPVYTLVVGKNGPKLAAAQDAPRNDGDGSIDIGNGEFIGRAATMARFVQILTDNLEQPVIDKTGLTGHYDFTLHFDQSSLPDWRLAPILFSLVQDMGLKLELQRTPVEMLVIDSIEQPSEN